MRQSQEPTRGATPQVITLGQELQSPLGVVNDAGRIAERAGAIGTDDGHGPRQRPKPLLVVDDHLDPCACGSRPRVCGHVEQPFGVPHAVLGGLRVDSDQRQGVVHAEHGSGADQLVR